MEEYIWEQTENNEDRVQALINEAGVTRPIALVLDMRGIGPEKIRDFLNPSMADIGDPYLLPGTKEAFHMVGEKQLALLPDGAVIINVGRGSVIDQEALARELKNGRLYAGLDVFEKEPLREDDPVWELPNLLITPHTAGNMTLEHTVNRIVEMFVEDLDRYCEGKAPGHLVDRTRGY